MTGSYVIEALGGSGANGTIGANGSTASRLGGGGAKITGTFQLVEGAQLKILVGQEGGIKLQSVCRFVKLDISPTQITVLFALTESKLKSLCCLARR